MKQSQERKAEAGNRRIKLPKLKWPLRMLLYLLTLLLSGLSLAAVGLDYFSEMLAMFFYVMAGCGLTLSGCFLYGDLRYGVKAKIRPGIAANPFAHRVTSDYRYRTMLSAHSSLAMNLLFALGNGMFGILYHSAWFGALSGYYLVLSIMRFLAIQYERKHGKKKRDEQIRRKELYVFRNCGILFIMLTFVLLSSVVQMVFYGQTKRYPGTLIFAVAAYTFYKIGIAVFHMFKVGKMKSPLLRVIRNIGYADAMVSMVSLQTAMFVSLGDDTDTRWMNLLTGGVVCLIILFLGIYMIRLAVIQLADVE
ncbi:MAG: hypothetical protein ACRDBO_13650 [Lachnospiraceae bacterium]